MAETTGISWTHHTFNPWRGCTKVSGGCKNCYADALSGRNPTTLGIWGPKGTRPIAAEAYWRGPLKWDRDAERVSERRRVFCASLADVFEGAETMPEDVWASVEAARARLMVLISLTPHLDWLLLTKRPERAGPYLERLFGITEGDAFNEMGTYAAGFCDLAEMRRRFDASVALGTMRGAEPWRNVWVGTSVEDQEAADARIPHLLRIPAAVRFLSCEPLLSEVDLRRYLPIAPQFVSRMSAETGSITRPLDMGWIRSYRHDGSLVESEINWVIAGGESGPNARPMHPDWARSLRDQCTAAGVPFHWKQNGEWLAKSQGGQYIPGRADLFREFPNGEAVYKVGVKRAGRLLDGVLHDSFPEVRS